VPAGAGELKPHTIRAKIAAGDALNRRRIQRFKLTTQNAQLSATGKPPTSV